MYTYSLSQPRHGYVCIYIYVYIYLPGSIWYTQDKQVHWLTQLIMDNSSDVRKRRALASLPRYLGMLFSIYIYTYISTLEHFFTVCWFKIHKQACTQQVFGKCNDITGIDLLKFIYFSLMSHLNFFFFAWLHKFAFYSWVCFFYHACKNMVI